MKILMLVISSDTSPVYAQHREVWKTYMKSHPDIDCYFITYRPLVFVPTRTDDTLYLRGFERYETIYQKTLDALGYFLRRPTYDYVVRTNLSSVWDFAKLRSYLETAPRTQFYAGQHVVNKDTGIIIASGAGMILSLDVVRRLLANREKGRPMATYDDVAIGMAIGLPPTSIPRVDFVSLEHYDTHHDKIPSGVFHYRIKHTEWQGTRMEEPVIMRRLLREHIYAA
jgi:hypothetical protein